MKKDININDLEEDSKEEVKKYLGFNKEQIHLNNPHNIRYLLNDSQNMFNYKYLYNS